MSELEQPTHETPDQLSDILLVLNKETMKLEAVKGMGKNGELETVSPDKQNENQFMKVDKHGDIFSNFFSNFISQLKNPTKFSFFKVPALSAIQTADEIQKAVEKSSPDGNQVLSKYEVIPNKQEEKQGQQEQPQNQVRKENTSTAVNPEETPAAGEYRFKVEDIDWETMSNLGLNQEKLEKMKILDPLLKGYKTNELIPISLNLGTAITRLDARLSLQQNAEGQVIMAIHGIRKEPNLQFSYFGHEFTKEDKENLLKTGNMGRIVDLTYAKTGELVPSIISVDRLTNELIALRADRIKVPDEIKGIKLNEHQKQILLEGKPLHLEGMISKKGEPFSADIQFNADKRYIEFLFDRNATHKQIQSNTNKSVQSVAQRSTQEAPTVFRDKRLNDEQYQNLKAGQTVYVDGLLDKKGKVYQGYITFDKETGKTDFAFNNPNVLKSKIQPKEENKTQVAVNSDGKTNESTKNSSEPLKSRQTNPDSKRPQRENTKSPTKSKGRKI